MTRSSRSLARVATRTPEASSVGQNQVPRRTCSVEPSFARPSRRGPLGTIAAATFAVYHRRRRGEDRQRTEKMLSKIEAGLVLLSESSSPAALPSLARHLQVVLGRTHLVILNARQDLTLQELGLALGKSRERVRQLQEHAQRSARAIVLEWTTAWISSWKRALRSPAVAEDELFGALVDVSLDVEAQHRLGRVALTMVVPGASRPTAFRGNDLRGWWTVEPLKLRDLIRSLSRKCPLEDVELTESLARAGVRSGAPARVMLREDGAPMTFHPGVFAWVRSRACHRDAAVAALRRIGRPQAAATLATQLGVTQRILYANLSRDRRFRQIKPLHQWGLSDWPGEIESPYATTVDAVVAVLREYGPLRRRELTARVIAVHPVSVWAVENALNSRAVGLTPSGLLDLAERGAKPAVLKPPKGRPVDVEESPDGRYLTFKKMIGEQVLRGSGLPVDSYVAWRVGLQHVGDRRRFTSGRFPPFEVRRALGNCNVSTLRQQASRLGGRPGDILSISLDLANDTYSIALEPPIGRIDP